MDALAEFGLQKTKLHFNCGLYNTMFKCYSVRKHALLNKGAIELVEQYVDHRPGCCLTASVAIFSKVLKIQKPSAGFETIQSN